MNIRFLTIVTILSLSLILGFEKISYSLNKVSQDNISELKILKYLPNNYKKLFISNTKISNITNIIRKSYKTKEEDELILLKNSLLAYLGIDLGTNKLEDIYNNEFTITTYDNKEKDIDDVLIIFKIKEKKNIDDVVNLTNEIDEPNKLIKIFRENKLNYLKYIYRTNDNYILTSSNKNLITDALNSSSIINKFGTKYSSFTEQLKNLKNENNILITKNIKTNELLNNDNYLLSENDYLITLFNFKDKEIILKSYLLNNNKSLDIMSYEKVDKKNILDKKNYQISIYNNLDNSNKYLDRIKIDNFEKGIFNELNTKLRENLLLFIYDNNWFLIFDKNKLSIDDMKFLEDFNKNSLENNRKIYTIYSKDKLKIIENTIMQSDYKKIYSIESDNLIFLSSSLINDADIDLLSKEFFNFRGDKNGKYFLNKKINLKTPYSIEPKNIPFLEDINYFFKNVINVSVINFKAIIKESIPETIPFYYEETNLKLT